MKKIYMSTYTQKGYLANINKDGSFDDVLIPLILESGEACYDEDDDRKTYSKHYSKEEPWNQEDKWEVVISFKKINKG